MRPPSAPRIDNVSIPPPWEQDRKAPSRVRRDVALRGIGPQCRWLQERGILCFSRSRELHLRCRRCRAPVRHLSVAPRARLAWQTPNAPVRLWQFVLPGIRQFARPAFPEAGSGLLEKVIRQISESPSRLRRAPPDTALQERCHSRRVPDGRRRGRALFDTNDKTRNAGEAQPFRKTL